MGGSGGVLERAAALVAEFEGLELEPYRCAAGFWMVGYGHRCAERAQPLTVAEAEALLLDDVRKADAALGDLVLSEGQRVALISFVFNVGATEFGRSTLRRLLLAGQVEAAADEFGRWVFAGSKPLAGLVRRRARERDIFLMGVGNG